MAKQAFNDEQKKFTDIFQKLDRDGNGKLSIQELKRGLKEEFNADVPDDQVAGMFCDIDVSGDQMIECDEFVKEMCKKPRRNAFEEEFKAIDRDGSGKLDKDEIKKLFMEVSPQGFNEEQIDKILQNLDKDGDGQINCEEFMALV